MNACAYIFVNLGITMCLYVRVILNFTQPDDIVFLSNLLTA